MKLAAATVLLAMWTLATVPERGEGQDASDRLAFERDFFAYPASARRDPFEPPADSSAGFPVVEDLLLLGIVHAAEPGRSLVLLAATGALGAAGAAPVGADAARGGDIAPGGTGTARGPADIAPAGTGTARRPADAAPGLVPKRTFRLRPGDRAGSVRVVEVGLDRVLVAVEEPDGRVRSAEIALPRRRPTGAQGGGS